ncbi:MAG: hypothetical protein HY040_24990 [Planctomycetes bacterium]|nr:hypothetical protein [Planctomycetota bacterium]
MGKRLFTTRSVAIVGCLVLVTLVVILGVWLTLGLGPRGPRLAINGGGTCSVGETAVEYVFSGDKIALAIWCAGIHGPSGSSSESGLFSSTSRGFFSSADGKRIKWAWQDPREKGGDFEIDGTRYDLADGGLFLLSTKDGQVRVTQLDVDLSQVQANTQGFEALAKKEPRIAKFIAEASGQK